MGVLVLFDYIQFILQDCLSDSWCLFLAGPGVLYGSFMTAAFLYLYLPAVGIEWDFLLCLTSGSILAATDPVAVVGHRGGSKGSFPPIAF